MSKLPSWDNLRVQCQIYNHVTGRDFQKRYIPLHFALSGCWLAGFGLEALVIWALVTAIEGLAYLGRKSKIPAQNISRRVILSTLALNVVGTVLYLTPAMMLASQSIAPLYLSSVMWIFGAIGVSSLMYTMVPTFFFSVFTLHGLAAFYVIISGVVREFELGPPIFWVFPVLSTVSYLGTFASIFAGAHDTHRELATTRAQSLERLRKLEFLSRHDALTGLPNRAQFDEHLGEIIARHGTDVSVLLVDLDGFKPINDTYGHDAGDAVLVETAQRLGRLVDAMGDAGDGALPARLGGDEFAIVLPCTGDRAEIIELAKRILASVPQPLRHEGKTLQVGVSVGLAFGAAGGVETAHELCAAADQAMYVAKARKDGQPVVYDASKIAARPSLETKSRLEQALREREIRPHYQPKIRISDNSVIGFEALARWSHPEKGLLTASAFLQDLRDLELMAPLTTAMLGAVLHDIRAWKADGLDPGRVAINLPEVMLATRTGRDDIEWLLCEYADCSENLMFEITEDVFIARSGDMIRETIGSLVKHGALISIDDFGTGYASFRHLQQLAFNELKIDSSFVAGLGKDTVSNVILNGFLSIARGLKAETVAEGVETPEQLEMLRDLGCTYAQGFLFSAAVPAADVPDILSDGQNGADRKIASHG